METLQQGGVYEPNWEVEAARHEQGAKRRQHNDPGPTAVKVRVVGRAALHGELGGEHQVQPESIVESKSLGLNPKPANNNQKICKQLGSGWDAE